MTVYDSSLLIDYLDGQTSAVDYVAEHVDERAVTVPLVLFEVYQGEVYGSSTADFDAIDRALKWVHVLETTAETARVAAELHDRLHRGGETLAARDAFIAGTAVALEEPLAVTDSDFDVRELRAVVDLDVV